MTDRTTAHTTPAYAVDSPNNGLVIVTRSRCHSTWYHVFYPGGTFSLLCSPISGRKKLKCPRGRRQLNCPLGYINHSTLCKPWAKS